MPKENINGVAMDQLRVEVAWKADPSADGTGYVQVATVHTDSPATIPHKIESATSGHFAVMPHLDPTRQALDGWHVTLDREQLNRLIRSLRRARDSAYGADA